MTRSTRSAPTSTRAMCCGSADLALAGELGRAGRGAGAASRRRLEAIPVVRALQRRLLMLAPARARIERGESRRRRHDVNGQVLVLEG